MQNLGFTRSSNQHDHILQTPDTFVRAPLPGMVNSTAIVHIAPARGAGFTQYTVEFQAGGNCICGPDQTFIYVLEGELTVSSRVLATHQYAYLPEKSCTAIGSEYGARAVFIGKVFTKLGEATTAPFFGDEKAIAPMPLGGDESLLVRTLFPDDPAYDFAVNTMEYQPGARLAMVEIHVMEHGLLMLEGEGIYRLGDHWYPVKAGDFIWMAPYCPQWFGALGKTAAKYLIYKDWNRHPLD